MIYASEGNSNIFLNLYDVETNAIPTVSTITSLS